MPKVPTSVQNADHRKSELSTAIFCFITNKQKKLPRDPSYELTYSYKFTFFKSHRVHLSYVYFIELCLFLYPDKRLQEKWANYSKASKLSLFSRHTVFTSKTVN